jgi:hypothetical protein
MVSFINFACNFVFRCEHIAHPVVLKQSPLYPQTVFVTIEVMWALADGHIFILFWSGDWKVPATRRLESLRHVAQTFLSAGSGDFPVA